LNAKRLLWLVAALAALWLWRHTNAPIERADGELAPEVPQQEAIHGNDPIFRKGDFRIKALARFSVTARVLSRADYHWDDGASLVPTDLALGWGRMSDTAVLDKIDISQSNRFYFWHTRHYPIPRAEIIDSSANMHLIPSDKAVERTIESTRIGDVVTFDGYLVEADRPGGFRWRSSMTRSDSGAGACELVWVQHFDIGPR